MVNPKPARSRKSGSLVQSLEKAIHEYDAFIALAERQLTLVERQRQDLIEYLEQTQNDVGNAGYDEKPKAKNRKKGSGSKEDELD